MCRDKGLQQTGSRGGRTTDAGGHAAHSADDGACKGNYELHGQADEDGHRTALAVGHRKLSGLEYSTLSLDAFKPVWTNMSAIEKDRSIIVVFVNNNHYWYFRPAEHKPCASPEEVMASKRRRCCRR